MTTSAELATAWIASGRAALPLPAAGHTAQRWRALTAMCAEDVCAGRLVEAHCDADAILGEVEGRRLGTDQLWGVWAAEPPTPSLDARPEGGRWRLEGAKAWCSGALACTHALVTARPEGEAPRLFAVDLDHPGVHRSVDRWQTPAMAGAQTGTVTFEGVPARAVGGPGSYLSRPGFHHGGIGVAACWLGGAVAVAAPLVERARDGRADAHQSAHLGAVDVALGGARWALDCAAAEVDREGPRADAEPARLRALRTRALVESAVQEVVHRVGRALGAAPLAHDRGHAGTVADVQLYIRQSHGERDLAALGEGVAAATDPDGDPCGRWLR